MHHTTQNYYYVLLLTLLNIIYVYWLDMFQYSCGMYFFFRHQHDRIRLNLLSLATTSRKIYVLCANETLKETECGM